jgi:hypothetical protein
MCGCAHHCQTRSPKTYSVPPCCITPAVVSPPALRDSWVRLRAFPTWHFWEVSKRLSLHKTATL